MLANAPQATWNADAVERLRDAVGGMLEQDDYGPAIAFADPGTASASAGVGGGRGVGDAAGFVAPLPDLGLLVVSGADAVKFLHGQLTNDIEHLRPGVARWTGYCSAKGRLLSTFRNWRDDAGLLLTVSRPLADTVRRRLAMFVLRAKARVDDASDAVAVFGLAGEPAARSAARAFGLTAPGAEAASSVDGHHLVGLPGIVVAGDVLPRWLLVVPAASAGAAWTAARSTAPAAGSAAWRRTEVLVGVPRIVPATYEQFVPQMINFESVDGVDFRKGCYPGQEVVARSQYLGKLKRRMFLARGRGATPAPGSDVVPVAGGEPCGQVVLAAPDGAGGFDLLFESQVGAIEAGAVRAGDAILDVGSLPYPLKAID